MGTEVDLRAAEAERVRPWPDQESSSNNKKFLGFSVGFVRLLKKQVGGWRREKIQYAPLQ